MFLYIKLIILEFMKIGSIWVLVRPWIQVLSVILTIILSILRAVLAELLWIKLLAKQLSAWSRLVKEIRLTYLTLINIESLLILLHNIHVCDWLIIHHVIVGGGHYLSPCWLLTIDLVSKLRIVRLGSPDTYRLVLVRHVSLLFELRWLFQVFGYRSLLFWLQILLAASLGVQLDDLVGVLIVYVRLFGIDLIGAWWEFLLMLLLKH